MANRIYITIPVAVTLVVTLWALSALIQLAVSVNQTIDTHIAGVSQHLGYQINWEDRFRPGQRLNLVRDSSMLPGYERVLVTVGRQVVGFLPEFQGGEQVRAAWQEGKPTSAEIIAVDPLDPARGLKTRVVISG